MDLIAVKLNGLQIEPCTGLLDLTTRNSAHVFILSGDGALRSTLPVLLGGQSGATDCSVPIAASSTAALSSVCNLPAESCQVACSRLLRMAIVPSFRELVLLGL